MANSPVVVIGITYRDRDGNRAKVTFYVAWTLTIADVWNRADALANAIDSISEALLYKIEILYRWRDDSPPEAPESSNVGRKLLLLITNDAGDINGMIIPSPVDIFETAGSYAGIRVDLLNASVLAFQDALGELDYRTDDDRQLGATIAAGGLAL